VLEALSDADLLELHSLLKYSPDQERDDAGRWSADGGSTSVVGDFARRVKEHFGTTQDVQQASFLLPDGTLLARRGSASEGLSGYLFHHTEVIDEAYKDRPESKRPTVNDVMQSGVVRLNARWGGWIDAEMGMKPLTPPQMNILREAGDAGPHFVIQVSRPGESDGGYYDAAYVGSDQETAKPVYQILREANAAASGQAVKFTESHDDLLRKYSEDQARDEAGRWTAGGADLQVKDYEGETGNRDHITRTEQGTIPTAALAHMRGERGEVPGAHRNMQGERWDAFKDDINQNGIKSPIFILVDPGKPARISEGNHRRDAAVELGLEQVPVEIRYFGHSEREGTVVERAGLKYSEDQERDESGRWTSGGSATIISNDPAAVRVKGPPVTVDQLREYKMEYEHDHPGTKLYLGNIDHVKTREMAQAIDQLARMQARFPRVNITEVSIRRDQFGPSKIGTIATCRTGPVGMRVTSVISLNPDYWTISGTKALYQGDSGWHPAGTSNPDGYITHEFGHALDQQTVETEVNWHPSESLETNPVSGYARTNQTEAFAEAFAKAYATGSTTKDEMAEFREQLDLIAKVVKYSEDQPRVPAGESGGGEFAGPGSTGGGDARANAAQAWALEKAWHQPKYSVVDSYLFNSRTKEFGEGMAKLTELGQHFPALREKLFISAPSGSGTGYSERGDSLEAQYQWYTKERGVGQLELADKFWAAGTKGSMYYDSAGFHPEGTENPAGTITHEFGHAVEDYLSNYGPRSVRDAYGAWATSTLAASDPVSGYGAVNAHEKFAELFCQTFSDAAPDDYSSPEGSGPNQPALRESLVSLLTSTGVYKANETTKRARTVTISSGGRKRDAALNPIVARVRQQLIDLVAEHSNRNKYSEDQPRDEAGKWTQGAGGMPDHAALVEAANSWAQVSDGIRDSVVRLRPNDDGKVLLDALANSPASAPPLYRGMALWPKDVEGDDRAAARFAALKPGDLVALNLSSWSSAQAIATDFAGGYPDPTATVPIMFEVQGGAQALSIAPLLEGGVATDFADQKEWLTGGEFRVESVASYKPSVPGPAGTGYRIVLSQTQTLANDPVAQAAL
jgi:hypothetical protein